MPNLPFLAQCLVAFGGCFEIIEYFIKFGFIEPLLLFGKSNKSTCHIFHILLLLSFSFLSSYPIRFNLSFSDLISDSENSQQIHFYRSYQMSRQKRRQFYVIIWILNEKTVVNESKRRIVNVIMNSVLI